MALDEERQRWLCPIAGGEPQKFNVVTEPDERALGFSADGKFILVRTRALPVKIFRIEIATGRRELWKEIVPADPSGVQSIPNVALSADGKSYAYSLGRILSDLYVVEGLK